MADWFDNTEEEAFWKEWKPQETGYTGEQCINCTRNRVELCANGKRRCEKCYWCPELKTYIADYS